MSDVGKVLRYRWAVFGIMALAYVLVYFHRQCPAVVALDLQEAFHASAGLVGVLASAYFYPYALLQLPAGLLSDSLGPRRTATIFLAVAVAGSILFGLASRLEVAVVARIMVGIGVSMVFIPTMKILSQWFRVSEFAFMSGILFTMGGIGVYVATAPLAVFSAWVGWRASFVIIGLATLAIAILVWLIVRNRPEDMGWPSLAEIDHLGPGFAAPPKQIPLWDGVRRVVSEPRFWVVAAWFTCTASIAFSFGALWAGPFLKHVYGMSQSQVGNVLSMIALGLILGSPFMSFLSDKVFKSRKKVITLSSALLVAELILLNLAPDRLPVFSLYILLFLFCVFASAVVVVGFATTKELFPVEIAGTSVGTANLFPFLGGAILQIVLGRVLDAYTKTPDGAYPLEAYSALLLILLAVGVAGLVCTFFIKETFPAGAR